jgi:hypothetical protein
MLAHLECKPSSIAAVLTIVTAGNVGEISGGTGSTVKMIQVHTSKQQVKARQCMGLEY